MPNDPFQVECNYNEKIYFSCNSGMKYTNQSKHFEKNFASIKL